MSEPSMPAPPEMGLFARAIGVLTSPRKTFEAVVANPRPVGIVFLVAVIIAAATALPQFTETGQQATLDMQVQQIEKFTGPVTDEMYSAMEKRASTGGYVTAVVGVHLHAGHHRVLWRYLLGDLQRRHGRHGHVQAGATSSSRTSSVISMLGLVLAVPIQYLKGSMSADRPVQLRRAAADARREELSLELPGLHRSLPRRWSILVTAIGLGVLYKRKTGPIAATLFIIYAVIAGGIAVYLQAGNHRMSRNKKILIGLVIVAILGAIVYANLTFTRTTGIEVTTEKIETRDLEAIVSASGTIQPVRRSTSARRRRARSSICRPTRATSSRRASSCCRSTRGTCRFRSTARTRASRPRGRSSRKRAAPSRARKPRSRSPKATFKRQEGLMQERPDCRATTTRRRENDLAMRRRRVAQGEQSLEDPEHAHQPAGVAAAERAVRLEQGAHHVADRRRHHQAQRRRRRDGQRQRVPADRRCSPSRTCR